ncbi:MAG: zinc ribbon domain-containing protein [Thermaerobacter sp.]|nr:zinc ribbon domain-containing protein [Thermaerobacter sp.]
MESRWYTTRRSADQVADMLERWFAAQGMQAQNLPGPGRGRVVQARERQALKGALGLARALTVTVTADGPERLRLELGHASWVDKAVVGGVAWLWLWPLAIPAAWGAWQQARLPEQILQAVERYLAGEEDGSPAGPETCPGCGAALTGGARYCPECGAAVPGRG